MLLKYTDILRSADPLNYICTRKSFPFSTAFLLCSNMNSIAATITAYAEQKQMIDKEYTSINAKGSMEITKGMEEKYLKAITELNDTEKDIPINKLPLSSFKDITVPPFFINCISFMIDLDN